MTVTEYAAQVKAFELSMRPVNDSRPWRYVRNIFQQEDGYDAWIKHYRGEVTDIEAGSIQLMDRR